MKVMIIYDSVFGNTEKVARGMGEALGNSEAGVFKVSDMRLELMAGVEFLMIGSPTRGFRPTEGITNFLTNLPENSLKGMKAAAFDTRIRIETIKNPIFRAIVKKGGFADKPMAETLRIKGAEVLATEGFLVADREGPLNAGELERAAEWVKGINQARKIV
jgi:flavodoxin I